jgi:hypothetical protein
MRSGALAFAMVAVFGGVFAVSCGSTPTEPASRDPLALVAQISPASIQPGGAAVGTFTLTNVSTRAITVGFPSSCHVLPYVRERHTPRLVHPSGAGYVCATIVTSLTLEPGQSMVQTLQIASTGRGAASAVASIVDLLAGDYNVYAEVAGSVDGRPFSLRSNALQFSVQ